MANVCMAVLTCILSTGILLSPALALCHSDRQSVLMKAPLIHKPALSTFDARQLSEGKRQPAIPFFFDICFP